MNIAEEIYQHAKQLPTDKALEVLNFITTIETENTVSTGESSGSNSQSLHRKVFAHRFVVDNVELPVRDDLYEHPFFGMNRMETKNALPTSESPNDILEFLQTLPVTNTRSDAEINQAFQSIRDEWQP
jgi:hypothetical protein